MVPNNKILSPLIFLELKAQGREEDI